MLPSRTRPRICPIQYCTILAADIISNLASGYDCLQSLLLQLIPDAYKWFIGASEDEGAGIDLDSDVTENEE
jgi:hypothetical protein